jgi:hypothetical protein
VKSTSLSDFNVHGSVHRKNIPIYVYIQQDATLHSLFYLETALHISGGTTTHHQERKQLYLQHLVFVRPLLLPAAIAAEYLDLFAKVRKTTIGFVTSVLPNGTTWLPLDGFS